MKTPHTEHALELRGLTAAQALRTLRDTFGDRLVDAADETVDVTETTWHRRMATRMTPGKHVRIYRERAGWSQAELGRRLGGLARQYVSGMERDERGISKRMAKRLAALFRVPTGRFI